MAIAAGAITLGVYLLSRARKNKVMPDVVQQVQTKASPLPVLNINSTALPPIYDNFKLKQQGMET